MQAYLYRDHKNGTTDSPLYQRLPPELRHQIYAHVVQADQSIHVFPPKGNEDHGYRLSLCEESSYDFELGHCNCEDGRHGRSNVRSAFFDNAIFLVSQSVRREALNAFFMTNKFTFTCLHELTRFTTKFKQSSSRIQRLRLFERVDDYPTSEYRVLAIQKARHRLRSLKHLELHIFISTWSAYETLYEDGLVTQLLHFALGPQPESRPIKTNDAIKEPHESASATAANTEKGDFDTSLPCSEGLVASKKRKAIQISDISGKGETRQVGHEPARRPPVFSLSPLKSFTPHVCTRTTSFLFSSSSEAKAEYYAGLSRRLASHLTEVFLDGGEKYISVADVPALMQKPKYKVRDHEMQPRGRDKRGLLFMED